MAIFELACVWFYIMSGLFIPGRLIISIVVNLSYSSNYTDTLRNYLLFVEQTKLSNSESTHFKELHGSI